MCCTHPSHRNNLLAIQLYTFTIPRNISISRETLCPLKMSIHTEPAPVLKHRFSCTELPEYSNSLLYSCAWLSFYSRWKLIFVFTFSVCFGGGYDYIFLCNPVIDLETWPWWCVFLSPEPVKHWVDTSENASLPFQCWWGNMNFKKICCLESD